MVHPAFMDLARIMYGSLLRCIEGLHRQNAVIADVLQAIRYVLLPPMRDFG